MASNCENIDIGAEKRPSNPFAWVLEELRKALLWFDLRLADVWIKAIRIVVQRYRDARKIAHCVVTFGPVVIHPCLTVVLCEI
jgi:hypothetical protein